jgi:hypothetical protein
VTESVTARCGGGVEGRAIESDSVPTCVRGMCGRPVPGLLARSSFFFLTFLFFYCFLSFFFLDFPFTQECGRTKQGRRRYGTCDQDAIREEGCGVCGRVAACVGQKGRRAARWKGGALGVKRQEQGDEKTKTQVTSNN